MYNFAPKGYICPLCLTASGVESDDTWAKQADIIYRDDLVVAMVNSNFIPGNEGHLIVYPTKHFENIFELLPEYSHRIIDLARHLSIGLKEVYQCDGVMLQQNNGFASGQRAFHSHLHLFPRYDDDKFFTKKAYKSDPKERISFARKMKNYLQDNPFTPE